MSTDISLEPLFNQSAEGTGSSKRVAFVPIDTVGAASHRTPITVNETAQEITITAGKRTVELMNTGSKVVYYGGVGVDDTKGIKLFPNSIKIYANVKDSFLIYVVCATSESSTIRVVEYD